MAAQRTQYQMVFARLRPGRLWHDIIFSVSGNSVVGIGDIRFGDDKRLIDFHRFGNLHLAPRRNALANGIAHCAGNVANLNAGNGNGNELNRLSDSRRRPLDLERITLFIGGGFSNSLALQLLAPESPWQSMPLVLPVIPACA